jgi:hypothetical protein
VDRGQPGHLAALLHPGPLLDALPPGHPLVRLRLPVVPPGPALEAAMTEILIHGPVCESWYLVFTEHWRSSGSLCKHDSCWDIMCLSDGPIGKWFTRRCGGQL